MKAIVFDKELDYVEDYPLPEPDEDEALIRISIAGICNTDLEIAKGYMGFTGVPGHEFVGAVETIKGEDQRLIGKRVVGEINIGCGACEYCMKGLRNHCQDRRVLGIVNKDGAMAEYVTLPLDNLHEVPESVSDEEAVFTEPLAAAFEITRQVHIRPTDRILVMGDGKLGLLIALVLNLSQAEVSLLGKHRDKLRIAEDQGLKTIIADNAGTGRGYDIVVEATGSARGFETALKKVNPRGVVVLKSTVAENKEINLAPVVINEVTVVGSRCGPFEPALRALSDRIIDVRPLITEVFPFEKAQDAFERAKAKDSLKILTDFRSG